MPDFKAELVSFAIDAYDGELARKGRRPRARDRIRRELHHFANESGKRFVHDLVREDYERYLNKYVGVSKKTGKPYSPSTLATNVSHVRGFSRFVYDRGWTTEDVAHGFERPKRQRPEDIPVVTVSDSDVSKLIDACETPQPGKPKTWNEILCIATAVYVGRRRAALANARRADADLEEGTVRFEEKGGKVIVVPVPDEYLALLREAEQHGVWSGPNEYLIPNRRPSNTSLIRRKDSIVYDTVKRVAERAGVRAHVHALRSAFAVRFDDQFPDQPFTLQDLMGHTNIETTKVYLRRRDKQRAMGTVRGLSWFPPRTEKTPHLQEEAHTGFEPVLPTIPHLDALAVEARDGSLLTPLQAKLELLRNGCNTEALR